MKQIPEVKTRQKVPSTQRAEKGLTLRKILRSTPPYYKNKAHDVVIKKLNGLAVTKGGLPAVTAICVDMSLSHPRPHKCSVISMDRPEGNVSRKRLKVGTASKVLVSCDCEDFCFTFEYAMWTWGAAKIKYCNGEPAVMKNPGNAIGVCKHLAALAKTIIEHGM